MRFFRGFVSCACCTTDPSSPTKPLVPPPSRTLRRKKRVVSQWRPSLVTISEDATSPHTDSVTAPSGGDVKKTSSSAAATSKVE
ncbi:hypothetical protein SESBI_34395 [Sesbania bispinosa]|nr:hypothetical protein SESBI_34395 [Sesbania bispinosa]